jgi:hypothetical protein
MSFLRHREIYRSDVGAAVRQGCALASPGIEPGRAFASIAVAVSGLYRNGERSQDRVPRSSSTMSLEPAIPWRGGLHQSPPPLHRPIPMLHRSAETVNPAPPGLGNSRPAKWGNFNRP